MVGGGGGSCSCSWWSGGVWWWLSAAAFLAAADSLSAALEVDVGLATEMPDQPFGGGSRMFVGSEHESFWWLAEAKRSGVVGARLNLYAFYAELAGRQAAARCGGGHAAAPRLPERPVAEAQFLRGLRTLRACSPCLARSRPTACPAVALAAPSGRRSARCLRSAHPLLVRP